MPRLGWGNCSACEEREEAAYREQAKYLYPPDQLDAEAFYAAFEKWGKCRSCKHVDETCRRKHKDGCGVMPGVPFPL